VPEILTVSCKNNKAEPTEATAIKNTVGESLRNSAIGVKAGINSEEKIPNPHNTNQPTV
jgi:hypothetical protein